MQHSHNGDIFYIIIKHNYLYHRPAPSNIILYIAVQHYTPSPADFKKMISVQLLFKERLEPINVLLLVLPPSGATLYSGNSAVARTASSSCSMVARCCSELTCDLSDAIVSSSSCNTYEDSACSNDNNNNNNNNNKKKKKKKKKKNKNCSILCSMNCLG